MNSSAATLTMAGPWALSMPKDAASPKAAITPIDAGGSRPDLGVPCVPKGALLRPAE